MAGSTPSLRTSDIASPIVSMAQPNTKLLAIFTAEADCGSVPATMVCLPNTSNTGCRLATVSAGPAGTMVNKPCAAKSGRPRT